MRKMSKYETQEELKREELSQEGQLLKTEVDNAKLTGDSMDVKMTDASEESKTNNTAGENKMGTMPMGKLLISVSLPMVISMLVQALYNVVDSVFVSHFDQDALTAVSTIFPLQNLMIGVTSGLGVGFNALISKSLGEKNQKKANDAARQGIFLELIGFAIFLLIGLFEIDAFMKSQTDVAKIIDYGVDYGRICCICSFGIFAQMTFERMLQSTGRTLYTMKTQALGAVINIILDPIMIFGYFGLPAMGAAGAAIATVIGQCIAASLAIYYNLKKNPDIQLSFKSFRPEGDVIGRILSIAVPSIAMVAVGSVMTYGFNRILFTFTPIAVSVFGIFYKVQSMAFMPVFGLNNGMIPIVSYNYGAKQPDRMLKAVKYTMMAAICFMLLCLTAMQVIPGLILKVFDAQEDMMAIGIPALRTMSISFLFAGICIVCSGMFQALGKGVYSLIVSLARQLIVLLPVAYAFAKLTHNLKLVWLSFPIAEVVSVILSVFMALQTKKKIIDPLKNSVKVVQE